jgi:hypothetical protein
MYPLLCATSFCPVQILRCESVREEILHFHGLCLSASVDHDEIDVSCKVDQDLPAGTAGRRKVRIVGDNGDGFEIPFAFGDGLEDSGSFRADGEAVRAVFNVTTAVDAPAAGEEGGSDAEFRVRGERTPLCRSCLLDEFFEVAQAMPTFEKLGRKI